MKLHFWKVFLINYIKKIGTDLFSDFFIYLCVLGLPLYEIIRQSNESAKKEAI